MLRSDSEFNRKVLRSCISSYDAQLVRKILFNQRYGGSRLLQIRIPVVDSRYSGDDAGDVIEMRLDHPRMHAEVSGPRCPRAPEIMQREVHATLVIESPLRLAPATIRTIIVSSCRKQQVADPR